jgi:hypothetical protein
MDKIQQLHNELNIAIDEQLKLLKLEREELQKEKDNWNME